jgi:hypothetical protein
MDWFVLTDGGLLNPDHVVRIVRRRRASGGPVIVAETTEGRFEELLTSTGSPPTDIHRRMTVIHRHSSYAMPDAS